MVDMEIDKEDMANRVDTVNKMDMVKETNLMVMQVEIDLMLNKEVNLVLQEEEITMREQSSLEI